MKSLEIVNKKINYCEEQEVPCVPMRLVSLQQIKQDLEVLEILRKHLRFMGENKTSLKLVNNGCVSNDLVKVKQWLEDNENETCN